jgi:prepilin-type N-terminal cleavage/methylation domain-containing protein
MRAGLAMRRLRALLSREGGFTIVELLMAISIGSIVLTAALMVLDRSMVLSNQVVDRSDALARGRQTMELLTRDLRSQVCLGTDAEPITEGKQFSVAFYADMTDGSDPNKIEKRRLAWNATTKNFTEDRWTPSGAYPDLVYAASPTKTRVIGDASKPIKDGAVDRPMFRYWAFKDGTTTGELEEVPLANSSATLSSTDVPRIVMVQVGFVSQTARISPKDTEATTLDDQVYVRSADPMQPEDGSRCL